MFRVPIAILCATLSLVTCQAVPGAEPLPPAARWIPQDALVVVELSDPEALLDLAFDPRMTEKVTSLPVYKQLISTPKALQFFGVIKFLEMSLGTDWRTALDKSIGGAARCIRHAHGCQTERPNLRAYKYFQSNLDSGRSFFLDLPR